MRAPSSDEESEQRALPDPCKTLKRRNKRKRHKNKCASNKVSKLKYLTFFQVLEPTDDDILLEAARESHSQPGSSISSASAVSAFSNFSDFLTVNRKFLDYQAELSRKFGSATTRTRRSRNSLPFGQLVRPKSTWPAFKECGLGMKRCEDGSFAFTHDKNYAKQQKAFYALRDVLDPQTLSVSFTFKLLLLFLRSLII